MGLGVRRFLLYCDHDCDLDTLEEVLAHTIVFSRPTSSRYLVAGWQGDRKLSTVSNILRKFRSSRTIIKGRKLLGKVRKYQV